MPTDAPKPAARLFGRELMLRAVSAVVLIAASAVCLILGGWVFAAFVAAASALILHEWAGITGPYKLRRAPWALRAFAAVTVAMAFAEPIQSAGLTLVVVIGLLIAASVDRRLVWLAGGVAYACLPGIATVMLRGTGGAGSLDLVATLYVFVVVWATDTGAYFSGRLIGGPKLAPRFSPKKTWSGAIGGTLAGVVCGVAVAALAGLADYLPIALVAMLLSVAGQIGDLAESALKRRFDVKDSGVLIPGHGGLMDRVDGLVVAVVVAVAFGAARAGETGIAAGLLVW
jgi:phosphatidate cytidylyltransferase